ncbi:MAG TPA: DUF2790 domain-containing protein, partial [Pseudomonas sp.]|nr:DUF2790 domain-containing protein [Pseudomonas sp.]
MKRLIWIAALAFSAQLAHAA